LIRQTPKTTSAIRVPNTILEEVQFDTRRPGLVLFSCAMRRSVITGVIAGGATVLLSQQVGFLIALGIVVAASLVVAAGLSMTPGGRRWRQRS
jgi:hypothetical protein